MNDVLSFLEMAFFHVFDAIECDRHLSNCSKGFHLFLVYVLYALLILLH